MATSTAERTTLTITKETHRRVRSLKRGGESYDELLWKMASQYDPDAVEVATDR